jgi:hypothetical protein
MTAEAAAPPFAHAGADAAPGKKIYRHSIAARTTHWVWTLAMLVLVMSGLQIFNAAPYLDASDKSDPAKRVLAFDADTADRPVGYKASPTAAAGICSSRGRCSSHGSRT